jgi:hypothetical protein
MSHKKHGLFTLVKVGVVAFCYIVFYEHLFISKDPRYDKLKHTTYIMFILLFTMLFIAFILSIFSKSAMQGGFILFMAILVCGTLFGMVEYFKIWFFFFKKFLDERDNK